MLLAYKYATWLEMKIRSDIIPRYIYGGESPSKSRVPLFPQLYRRFYANFIFFPPSSISLWISSPLDLRARSKIVFSSLPNTHSWEEKVREEMQG